MKQLVRDMIAPDKDLGHSESKRSIDADFLQDDTLTTCDPVAEPASLDSVTETCNAALAAAEGDGAERQAPYELMDDEAAEQARRAFGVW